MLVPGATMLSQQEAENKPKQSYNTNKLSVTYTKGKGKHQKNATEVIVYKTRKTKLASHHINMSKEAYEYMLDTPTSSKFAKIVNTPKGKKKLWNTFSIKERLKHHFDQIAHDFRAVSYSYEVLGD